MAKPVRVDGRLDKLRKKLRKLLSATTPDVHDIVLKYRAMCKMAAKETVESLVGDDLLPVLREILKTNEARVLLAA